jgi:hypothetical protein
MKTTFILSTILLATIFFPGESLAQTPFELPKNIELNTKNDYVTYESNLVNAATWLEQSDLDKEVEKRKDVNAFIIKYVTGTPNLTIDVNPALVKLTEKNIQLLTIYLASYAKYVIETKNPTTRIAAIKAALVSTINVYKKGIAVARNKEMEKICKMSDADLDKYILEKFK